MVHQDPINVPNVKVQIFTAPLKTGVIPETEEAAEVLAEDADGDMDRTAAVMAKLINKNGRS